MLLKLQTAFAFVKILNILDEEQYKKRLLLRCIHHFKSDLIYSMTICAFRVLNPHQRSLAKQSNIQQKRIFEPFHTKTYNLDWRHNLLKRRHKFAENFS